MHGADGGVQGGGLKLEAEGCKGRIGSSHGCTGQMQGCRGEMRGLRVQVGSSQECNVGAEGSRDR